jgi:hypothetical protein
MWLISFRPADQLLPFLHASASLAPLPPQMPQARSARHLHEKHGRATATSRGHRQKWSNMANLGRSHHRRWRGVALGGHLQRGSWFCLASQGGQATTGQIAEWCRPEIVYAGGKPTAIQIAKHARALRSIGARKIRRGGRQWVWRLDHSSG